MFYGLALLFVLAAAVLGIPAWRQLQRMRRINRNAVSTKGYVATVRNALGWLWASGFGNVIRPMIKYESSSGKEMAIEVATSSMLLFRRYEPGMRVEVVYDSTSPWEAYCRPEWDANQRDFWMGMASLALAVIMYVAGRLQAM